MASTLEIVGTKITSYFILIALTTLVAWSYYVLVVLIILGTVKSIALKIIFMILYHCLLLLMEISFFRAVICKKNKPPFNTFRIDPEAVTNNSPLSDQVSIHGDQKHRLVQLYNIQQRMNDGSIRVCPICNIVKPDRTHHCSYCGHCILKMDHHCPWVCNCLGFYNYKFFILYLFYVMAYCLFIAGFSLFVLTDRNTNKAFSLLTSNPFQLYILAILSLCFLFGVGVLLGYHIKLILENKTTLEESRDSNFVNGIISNPYNFTKSQNWIQVFGTNKFLWFFPVFSGIGDGLKFNLSQDNSISAF